MANKEKTKRDPQEHVEHMNSIFDRLVLPMLIFTLALFLIFGVFPKIKACTCAGSGGQQPEADEQQQNTVLGALFSLFDWLDPEADTQQETQPLSAYDRRDALLADFDENSSRFEAAGFTLADNDGEQVAYRMLDSGVEIFENMKDSNGYRVSILSLEEGEKRIVLTVYSENIFLVSVKSGDAAASAIFDNDAFTAGASGSDPGQSDVLALAGGETLSGMVSQYLAALEAVGSVETK